MHRPLMRRLVPALMLTFAACAPRPQQAPPPPQQTVVTPSPHRQSDLLGLTASELVQRFGNPALQVREGTSVKLQFRGRGCVLDAYLYPPPTGGVQRVSHIDTRFTSGVDASQQACITARESR